MPLKINKVQGGSFVIKGEDYMKTKEFVDPHHVNKLYLYVMMGHYLGVDNDTILVSSNYGSPTNSRVAPAYVNFESDVPFYEPNIDWQTLGQEEYYMDENSDKERNIDYDLHKNTQIKDLRVKVENKDNGTILNANISNEENKDLLI